MRTILFVMFVLLAVTAPAQASVSDCLRSQNQAVSVSLANQADRLTAIAECLRREGTPQAMRGVEAIERMARALRILPDLISTGKQIQGLISEGKTGESETASLLQNYGRLGARFSTALVSAHVDTARWLADVAAHAPACQRDTSVLRDCARIMSTALAFTERTNGLVRAALGAFTSSSQLAAVPVD